MAWSASALSLGSPRGNVVLGAPFDVVVGVQPDNGTELAASCVSAQLHAGDRPIEASRVRVTPLSSGNAVRVQSSYMVDEPVLTLKLLAGCQGTMSRSYTLLSQLPEAAQTASSARSGNQPINVAQLASSVAVVDPAVAADATAPVALPALGNLPSTAASAPASGAGARNPSRAPAQRNAASPAPTPGKSQAQARNPSQTSTRTSAKPVKPNKVRDAAATAAASALGAAQPQLRIEPRLRMEPLEDWLGPEPRAPAVGAAADAPAPAPDATAEQLAQARQRVQALAAELDALKKRGGSDSAQIAQMRSDLEALRQESGSSSWLFNALLLALIAAVALIGWLAWRLRSSVQSLFSRDQRAWRASVERSSGPLDEAALQLSAESDGIDTVITQSATNSATNSAANSGPDSARQQLRSKREERSPYLQRGIQMQPGATYELHEDLDPGNLGPATMPVGLQSPARSGPSSMAAPSAASAAPAYATVAATLPAAEPAGQRADGDKARRMVRPEQLFDVQQQAEFFISVGEHQQAIALLRSHIDAHEDSSPLAYLELLHLYYTLSRREEYEQLRERFAQHFNARVPGMAGFTDKGQGLLQAYPEQLARIEALWPIDEVRSCLAHYLFKVDGVAAQDAPPAFDLAAFEELLLLLSIVDSTSAQVRGELQGRVRTTPQPGPSAVPAVASAAAAAAPQGPATATLDAGLPLAGEVLSYPDASPAAPVPAVPLAADRPQAFLAASAGDDAGLEFVAPETLKLDLPPAVSRPSSPDSPSAPLDFDLQQLDFDMGQAELPNPGRRRSLPLDTAADYRGEGRLPMLDIDLTALAEEDASARAELPSRLAPEPAHAPAAGGSAKMPLDMDLKLDLESWQLEPPDTLPGPQGLDEPLSRSVDMLLSRDTDPVFRKGAAAGEPSAPEHKEPGPPKA